MFLSCVGFIVSRVCLSRVCCVQGFVVQGLLCLGLVCLGSVTAPSNYVDKTQNFLKNYKYKSHAFCLTEDAFLILLWSCLFINFNKLEVVAIVGKMNQDSNRLNRGQENQQIYELRSNDFVKHKHTDIVTCRQPSDPKMRTLRRLKCHYHYINI